ncbi:hypothetical protein [Pseudoroseomonas sp. WGS1072]|uniref:hypothetical protein n=1 Tax=Roseomonas sp. WGS1072 TaxID=3366816 RepID=UPI003BF01834
MTAAATLHRLEEAGVEIVVQGDQLRLRGQKPADDLLAEARTRKVEIIQLLAERDARDTAAERAAIQEEPPAPQPAPEPRRLIDGLLSAGLQRPPSWPDPAARPAPGAWCGCCGRFDPRQGGRWWRDLRNEWDGGAPGWCCATCHPPDHLAPDQYETVRS